MTSEQYVRRLLLAAGVLAGLVLVSLLLWQVGQVLLVVFAGVLLAVLWSGGATAVAGRTPLGYKAAVGLEAVGCLTAVAFTLWLAGPPLATQLSDLVQRVPESLDRLQQQGWLQWANGLWNGGGSGETGVALLSRLGSAFSTALGVVGTTFIVLFIGFYGALDPTPYIGAAQKLCPPARRERFREVLAACAHGLRWWLVGRLASMTVVGLLTTIALLIAGVPLPLVLGLLAGLFSFVPYVGPVVAAVPALLVAAGEGTSLALVAAAIYLGVQGIENNLITPLIQHRAVSLPPAALLAAQLLGGVMFGILGVLLATPLAVAVIIVVQLVYVEDVLGDSARVLGTHPTGLLGAQRRS